MRRSFPSGNKTERVLLVNGEYNVKRDLERLKRVGFRIGFSGEHIVNKLMNFEIPRTGIY
jgi:hypothetical protein